MVIMDVDGISSDPEQKSVINDSQGYLKSFK